MVGDKAVLITHFRSPIYLHLNVS